MDLISDSPSRDAKLIDEELCELVNCDWLFVQLHNEMGNVPLWTRGATCETRNQSGKKGFELAGEARVGCWSTDRQNRQRKRLAAPSDYVRRTGAKWTTDANGRQSMQYYSYRRRRRRRRRRHHNLQSHMYSSKR